MYKRKNFIEPFDDADMIYDKKNRRYVLTPEFVAENGLDLSYLQTAQLTNPADAVRLALNRVSELVYAHIYSYGRNKEVKEYLISCREDLRNVIRDAMIERLKYMSVSGDLSVLSGAIIEQGVRIDKFDLIVSPVEYDLLLNAGLLHIGKYNVYIDPKLKY